MIAKLIKATIKEFLIIALVIGLIGIENAI